MGRDVDLVSRIGFWSAVVTTLATTAFVVLMAIEFPTATVLLAGHFRRRSRAAGGSCPRAA